ncbi:50S ribosomal protein L19 [Spiroplasma turonicum]|uniref:Large ribosomal subunit protein bL19 n=1 Tax=Spiroplasma turonicum TaxID=216946 RepID=A0A0K1P852_9MOLU|nr:50S ribosomal protein L19 [Spiroplasma turonicum]ALX71059.1 50S ribosomal protein L19 [Spiroplasma turonicum]
MNMLTKTTKSIVDEQLNSNLPRFTSGDTIRVNVKIKEGEKFRIQAFEGVVIKTQGSGITFSVCVRKNSNGVFVERTFPVHSPIIDSIDVLKRGRVRRARIYYIRKLSGKAARIKEIIVSKDKKNAAVSQSKTSKKVVKPVEPKVENKPETND